ncbi:ABC transporter substrate-binding protein/permease [Erysipelothrix sp. HDW6A]|uniref:ABC transporter substrate-binding protein/permease n=1 Tax=Erysipelothrix sp. HDW6A TaxID=2714928 RepID=UPI00140873CE|nr:ABC transporter substrate-binding protein/permease [Erysipelothrix sp. HDW6A]QIK56405.1 ABC transporter substrate-binding protein/permease [Erysipelothrix sp. HDW6A]
MKKLLTLLCLIFVLTACSVNNNDNDPQNLLEEIQQRGELVVATSPDYAPYEFIDPSQLGQNKYVGADMELAKLLAKELGVDLVIKPMSFDDIPSSIIARKYDIGLSGFTYTEERAQAIQFSISYDSSESKCQGFLVSDTNTFDSLDDFDKATVSSQNGSLQQEYVNEQLPNANVRLVTSLDDAVMELKAGKTDAVAISCASGETFLKNNSGIKISDVKFNSENEQGIMAIMPKGEPELLNAVNEILNDVVDSGKYQVWMDEAVILDAEVSNMGDGVKPTIFTLAKTYGDLFWEGTIGTLWLSAVVVFFGTIFGALLTLAKMSKLKLLNIVSSVYVEIVRGTPILLQLYLFVYGGAQLLPNMVSDYMWVVIALIFNSSAYVAEVFRSGIQAVDKGQFEAAKSLGLSDKNMMIKVILPQAIKNILPALGNEFIMMIKETSLASIFFINSLMTTQSIISAATHMKFETLIIVGIIYFILTFTLSKVITHFERKGNRTHA